MGENKTASHNKLVRPVLNICNIVSGLQDTKKLAINNRPKSKNLKN